MWLVLAKFNQDVITIDIVLNTGPTFELEATSTIIIFIQHT